MSLSMLFILNYFIKKSFLLDFLYTYCIIDRMNGFTLYKNPCSCCSESIEDARAELGLRVCLSCAKRGVSQSRYMGAQVYEHKTAGFLQVMLPDTFADFKAKTSRKGQSSTLRNVLVGGGRLQ